jgi:hypothetical protein
MTTRQRQERQTTIYRALIGIAEEVVADSGDCGRVFRLIADSDSDRSRTAFR